MCWLSSPAGQTISEQTRARVLAEAARLGYRPHTAARALASGRSHLVLLVLPDWPLDFNLRRNIEEASLVLDEAGYALVTYTPHATGHARPLWETLQPDVVVGLRPFDAATLDAIHAAGVERVLPDPAALPVEEYPEQGPGLQIQHLHSLGHRHIAYAGSADPRVADLVCLRRARAFDAAQAHGLPAPATADVELADASVSPVLDDWLKRGITAVAAYNDDVAAAIVGAALRAGLRVPEDLAVVGHDDTPLASVVEPRLTTVHIDIAGLGRYLAQLALAAVEDRDPPAAGPELRATLVVRASTQHPGTTPGTDPRTG